VLEAELVSIVGIDTVMEENSPIVVVTVAVVKFYLMVPQREQHM
jgi:hypothetical protein